MAVQAAAATKQQQRAHADTQENGKENLGSAAQRAFHTCRKLLFLREKSAHSDLLYCSSYLPPLATLFYTVCTYSKA